MAQRVARWGEIPASARAFVDTGVQGRERRRYSVVGSGVSDDPNLRPRSAAAENVHVNGSERGLACLPEREAEFRAARAEPLHVALKSGNFGSTDFFTKAFKAFKALS
ncbi:hypothetical protein D5039_14310 [Verminephrobacter aporrectodeae subsp. tuberculatae]|uniref:Uncharacterized protein n=1 Tax=Verminephrobacter aporrectodeae subsp. tuberculatae TaxID=1110392 RepID=A0ABT3KVB5_9BURK|nr:hypothetical protein [Verminephrobacter aporrectodeae]MCW5322281.1 hypothetical protein [Verminephrobacter aporrectodeae subsp. tuberculatae]